MANDSHGIQFREWLIKISAANVTMIYKKSSIGIGISVYNGWQLVHAWCQYNIMHSAVQWLRSSWSAN